MLVPFHGARRCGDRDDQGPGDAGHREGLCSALPRREGRGGGTTGRSRPRPPSGGSCTGSPPCRRAASPALALTAGGSRLSWLARDRSARDARPGREGQEGAGPDRARRGRRPGVRADWLEAQGTSRSAHALPRRAALHAAFTCGRPSLPRAAGLRTWARRASAQPGAGRGRVPPRLAACFGFHFLAKGSLPSSPHPVPLKAWGMAVLCKFARGNRSVGR